MKSVRKTILKIAKENNNINKLLIMVYMTFQKKSFRKKNKYWKILFIFTAIEHRQGSSKYHLKWWTYLKNTLAINLYMKLNDLIRWIRETCICININLHLCIHIHIKCTYSILDYRSHVRTKNKINKQVKVEVITSIFIQEKYMPKVTKQHTCK